MSRELVIGLLTAGGPVVAAVITTAGPSVLKWWKDLRGKKKDSAGGDPQE